MFLYKNSLILDQFLENPLVIINETCQNIDFYVMHDPFWGEDLYQGFDIKYPYSGGHIQGLCRMKSQYPAIPQTQGMPGCK